ncbi:MAG: M28 family peptidase [Pyrinomonadaceae bacterium]|nr:M28 family peptidase [Pyrinomonadaceae bacterium]
MKNRNYRSNFLVGFLAVVLAFSLDVNSQKAKTGIDDGQKASAINSEQLLKDVKYLSSDQLRGREAGTPDSRIARQHILERFLELRLPSIGRTHLQEFTFTARNKKTVEAANVIGFVKGAKNPKRYIVITAHYDHVGVRRGEIYNGADDNASGTAALMAFAKYFKNNPPNNTILFVALDAEEKGLQGARFFVDNLPMKQESILLNINMDMISRSDKNELYTAGLYHYPKFKPHLDAIQNKAKIKLLYGHDRPELKGNDWTFQSDHGVFHRRKIPFLYFGVEDHKDYHKPSDVFENIQPKFYVNAVETILMAIKEIDEHYQKQ